MNNKDMPITPFIKNKGSSFEKIYSGLTKREHFAATAMQGILSNRDIIEGFCAAASEDPMPALEGMTAKLSLEFADALLKELEES